MVLDYLSENENTLPLFRYKTNIQGFSDAIEDRKRHPVNRKLLTQILEQQYAHLEKSSQVMGNLKALSDDSTFTVCTAHQPNLLTGYLYFIYKIVHAIKLAETLKAHFPDKHFVPVYYMGSEDNDLEELGTFRYNNKKFNWDAAQQTGAVGRMHTGSLKTLLAELFRQIGPPGNYRDELEALLTNAYLRHTTIAAATQYLVNELFGKYGLIVLNPDEPGLKNEFLDIMQDDLLLHTPEAIVTSQIKKIEEHYKSQAHPRAINLFYLKDNIRERIEQTGDRWSVLNTEIKWTRDEILAELRVHPERFSPNVILRGLFQETILPDIAFIGGGAEVAYWLQLKPLFDHYKTFYPPVLLRQSVLWIGKHEQDKMTRLGLSAADIFQPEHDLIRRYLLRGNDHTLQLDNEMTRFEEILTSIRQKATDIDPTLHASAEAALAKIKHQVHVLEKKMLRAEKKKKETEISRLTALRAALFPGNALQERVENFVTYYLEYGAGYLDLLKDAMQPLKHQFLVLEEKQPQV